MKKIGKNAKLYLIGMIIGGMTLGLTTVIADTIINSTNVSYKTTTVKAALDDLYGLTADDIWKKIYPIGSIYISVNSTSPATLFGGTWVAFAEGRTLIGVGIGTDDYNTQKTFAENNTGGYYTHQHAYGMEFGTWYGVTNFEGNASSGLLDWNRGNPDDASLTTSFTVNVGAMTGYSSATISDVPINPATRDLAHYRMIAATSSGNTLQPYVTVYMWKRTA